MCVWAAACQNVCLSRSRSGCAWAAACQDVCLSSSRSGCMFEQQPVRVCVWAAACQDVFLLVIESSWRNWQLAVTVCQNAGLLQLRPARRSFSGEPADLPMTIGDEIWLTYLWPLAAIYGGSLPVGTGGEIWGREVRYGRRATEDHLVLTHIARPSEIGSSLTQYA